MRDGRNTGAGHAQVAIGLLELHSEVQALTLQELGDLGQRLLADVLDLEQVLLGELDQILEGPDVGVLERVERADGETEVVDQTAEALAQVAAGGTLPKSTKYW
jgi:hypothetical protein